MKKSIQIVLMLFSILLWVSCGKQKEEKHEHSKTEKAEEHQHANTETISLNNGELWVANKETTDGIDRMINLMDSFTDKESVKAYAALKTDLDQEFGTILKECTMKGESHNQLHLFLVPMQEMFEGLTSSDLQICKKNYELINDHLKKYERYFK